LDDRVNILLHYQFTFQSGGICGIQWLSEASPEWARIRRALDGCRYSGIQPEEYIATACNQVVTMCELQMLREIDVTLTEMLVGIAHIKALPVFAERAFVYSIAPFITRSLPPQAPSNRPTAAFLLHSCRTPRPGGCHTQPACEQMPPHYRIQWGR